MLLFLWACSETAFHAYDDKPGAGRPEIEVSPTRLDYGTLGLREELVQSFDISNVGDEGSILDLSDIEIEGSSSFSILNHPGDLDSDLAIGDLLTIDVAFTPLDDVNVAKAIIFSNDADTPQAEVELLGHGNVPELEIIPDPLDLGQVLVGCLTTELVTLTNIGTADLEISTITETGDTLSLLNTPTLPLTLEPGAYTTVEVQFVPLTERLYEGGITVESNEIASPRFSPHTAEGVWAPMITDHWDIPLDPPTDILFFVDQSCSMDDDAAALASNFSDFITQLSTYTENWQIIVANDDNGCNNSGILTINTGDYATPFATAVTAGGGTWTEAGLTVASAAIENTDSGECNEGFMRPDALLHLILVSDEPEQSASPWSDYVSQIVAKKGDASLVRISAIAGDYPSGCASATAGTGYYEAVTATGGEFLSICSNWSSNVSTLADASIIEDTFVLSGNPILDTLTVTRNGGSINGWVYDANSNAVIFTTDIPVKGDSVDISYHPYVPCN